MHVPMQPTVVGDVVVQPIFDGIAILRPEMFTVAGSPADWTHHHHLVEPDGTLRLPVGAFVVRVGDRVILLDAGVGETTDVMFEGHALLANLAAAGIRPDEIDTVVVSHLHDDHYGWLERNGTVTFPNATIHIGAADWDHFVEQERGGRRRAARLRCVAGQVELIHADGVAIAPGITTRLTPGHTPGHISTVISSGAQRLIVLGDALHCPAQLTETEWQFLYDIDRDLASRTRDELLREAEVPGTAVLPAHFPGMVAARLLPATGTRHWVLG